MHVTCPSGLSCRIRGLKVGDQRVLADKRLSKSGEVVDALLRACVLEVTEPGPYRFPASAPRWDEVLVGDRVYLFTRLGVATHGPHYDFKATCPECSRRFPYRINVEEDLRVQALPEASRAIIAGDGIFETDLDGERIRFRLMTGADERKLAQLMRGAGNEQLATTLSFRILDAGGREGREKKTWLEDLGFADLGRLLAAFDEADCGVDTDLTIECPECSSEIEIAVPFGPEFLVRKAAKKAA